MSQGPGQGAGAVPTPRIAAVDALRGGAVLLMIVYHGLWDATFLGLLDLPLLSAWPWLVARASVLTLFLGLAGLSLTLAHGAGFRPRPFLRRLAGVALGAALITAGTAVLFPPSYVFFGALHHIALASLLGLALLRLPGLLLAAVGAGAFILPLLAEGLVVPGGLLDRPPLLILGLASTPPDSVDFVPLLPWFAAWPAGMLLGRATAWAARPPRRGWTAWQPASPAARLLTLAGRHSLIVYLVHQAPLMGVLWLLARLT